eukprot:CAMPEP_0118688216 /NCGR_PEP_ID=MMETSP0800-20121206/8799_1 /TAXON_ID=210618 ORGANISM="Striatella unipunctata, Strain CCMP2910" /NCGR_SAMPLE_ID=MMETSP0800 /ASSEMBLY_ACC=CAM_ASM_000638 /LENGTH=249 /DNA_ID=CAMNT_0006585455 /DNA_START=12 /DNA_END=758 /DNA_ORIENTATION=+
MHEHVLRRLPIAAVLIPSTHYFISKCEGRRPKLTRSRKAHDPTYYNLFPLRQLWKPPLPYPLWAYDWDKRDLTNTRITRHIVLIRHAQYDETHEEDEKRKLTPLGIKQAELTGKRLAEMFKGAGDKDGAGAFPGCPIKVIRVSGMRRAKETAEVIAKYLPGVVQAEPDPRLNEGTPAQIIPVRHDIDAVSLMDESHDRIEEAFQEYFRRAIPGEEINDGDEHVFDIIVCHGNVIRYFFCRALQLPPEAW